jgi:hypothetical protein
MSAHSYWRVNCTQTQATPQFFGCSELIMRDVASGVQKATGGTAIASSAFGFAPASQAFDGTAAAYLSSSQTMPQWIGYQFSAPIELAELVFTAQPGPDTAPIAFTIDHSDDG